MHARGILIVQFNALNQVQVNLLDYIAHSINKFVLVRHWANSPLYLMIPLISSLLLLPQLKNLGRYICVMDANLFLMFDR